MAVGDEEAKKSICAIFVQNESVLPLIEDINLDYFKTTPKYYILLTAMKDMFESGKRVDSISLRAYLKMNRLLKKAGGNEMIADIASMDAPPSKLDDYLDIVRKEYKQGQLAGLANDILLNISAGADPDDLSKTTIDKTLEIEEGDIGSQILHLGDIAANTINSLITKPDVGISTGYYGIDDLTGGLTTSYIIIAGRPSMGKSAFVQNIMSNVGKQGVPGLIFSIEMSARQLGIRLLSQESGLSYHTISRGDYNAIEYERLEEAAGIVRKLPIYVDDSPRLTVGQIQSRTIIAKKRYGIQYIVVDYLQLIKPSERNMSKWESVSDISTRLKSIVKQVGIPVIAVSQLSRDIEKRKGEKQPQLSDLRESGQLEQDADLVWFVHRPDYWDKKETESEDDPVSYLKKAEIIVAKQRNGPTGTVSLFFNKKCMRFSNDVVNYK